MVAKMKKYFLADDMAKLITRLEDDADGEAASGTTCGSKNQATIGEDSILPMHYCFLPIIARQTLFMMRRYYQFLKMNGKHFEFGARAITRTT